MAQNLMAAAEGFDPALLNPPWEFHAQLRANAPVFEVPGLGFYLVTKYEDVSTVLKDDKTFSNRFPSMFGTGLSFAPATPAKEAAHAKGYKWEPTLFFSDAPEHRRHRDVLQLAFSPRRVRQLESMVQRLCDEILDGLDLHGSVDFATEVAFELPTMVIGEAVGVAREDRPRFRYWADAVVRRLGEQLPEDEDIRLIEAYVDAQRYFAAEIRLRQSEPRDDLLSDIVGATLEGEDPLSLEELLAIVTILPVAGTETSAGLIGLTLLHLLEAPELMSACRREPAAIEAVIEETLRFESPIQAWFRRAAVDTSLGGVAVPKDAMLLVVIASGNRDESRWSCPAEFHADRPDVKDHLAFGRGRHFCVGSNLARAEARIAISSLLQRFGAIELAGEPEYRTNMVHRMLETLPVRLAP
jgi:cytochrome P450